MIRLIILPSDIWPKTTVSSCLLQNPKRQAWPNSYNKCTIEKSGLCKQIDQYLSSEIFSLFRYNSDTILKANHISPESLVIYMIIPD